MLESTQPTTSSACNTKPMKAVKALAYSSWTNHVHGVQSNVHFGIGSTQFSENLPLTTMKPRTEGHR